MQLSGRPNGTSLNKSAQSLPSPQRVDNCEAGSIPMISGKFLKIEKRGIETAMVMLIRTTIGGLRITLTIV